MENITKKDNTMKLYRSRSCGQLVLEGRICDLRVKETLVKGQGVEQNKVDLSRYVWDMPRTKLQEVRDELIPYSREDPDFFENSEQACFGVRKMLLESERISNFSPTERDTEFVMTMDRVVTRFWKFCEYLKIYEEDILVLSRADIFRNIYRNWTLPQLHADVLLVYSVIYNMVEYYKDMRRDQIEEISGSDNGRFKMLWRKSNELIFGKPRVRGEGIAIDRFLKNHDRAYSEPVHYRIVNNSSEGLNVTEWIKHEFKMATLKNKREEDSYLLSIISQNKRRESVRAGKWIISPSALRRRISEGMRDKMLSVEDLMLLAGRIESKLMSGSAIRTWCTELLVEVITKFSTTRQLCARSVPNLMSDFYHQRSTRPLENLTKRQERDLDSLAPAETFARLAIRHPGFFGHLHTIFRGGGIVTCEDRKMMKNPNVNHKKVDSHKRRGLDAQRPKESEKEHIDNEVLDFKPVTKKEMEECEVEKRESPKLETIPTVETAGSGYCKECAKRIQEDSSRANGNSITHLTKSGYDFLSYALSGCARYMGNMAYYSYDNSIKNVYKIGLLTPAIRDYATYYTKAAAEFTTSLSNSGADGIYRAGSYLGSGIAGIVPVWDVRRILIRKEDGNDCVNTDATKEPEVSIHPDGKPGNDAPNSSYSRYLSDAAYYGYSNSLEGAKKLTGIIPAIGGYAANGVRLAGDASSNIAGSSWNTLRDTSVYIGSKITEGAASAGETARAIRQKSEEIASNSWAEMSTIDSGSGIVKGSVSTAGEYLNSLIKPVAGYLGLDVKNDSEIAVTPEYLDSVCSYSRWGSAGIPVDDYKRCIKHGRVDQRGIMRKQDGTNADGLWNTWNIGRVQIFTKRDVSKVQRTQEDIVKANEQFLKEFISFGQGIKDMIEPVKVAGGATSELMESIMKLSESMSSKSLFSSAKIIDVLTWFIETVMIPVVNKPILSTLVLFSGVLLVNLVANRLVRSEPTEETWGEMAYDINDQKGNIELFRDIEPVMKGGTERMGKDIATFYTPIIEREVLRRVLAIRGNFTGLQKDILQSASASQRLVFINLRETTHHSFADASRNIILASVQSILNSPNAVLVGADLLKAARNWGRNHWICYPGHELRDGDRITEGWRKIRESTREGITSYFDGETRISTGTVNRFRRMANFVKSGQKVDYNLRICKCKFEECIHIEPNYYRNVLAIDALYNSEICSVITKCAELGQDSIDMTFCVIPEMLIFSNYESGIHGISWKVVNKITGEEAKIDQKDIHINPEAGFQGDLLLLNNELEIKEVEVTKEHPMYSGEYDIEICYVNPEGLDKDTNVYTHDYRNFMENLTLDTVTVWVNGRACIYYKTVVSKSPVHMHFRWNRSVNIIREREEADKLTRWNRPRELVCRFGTHEMFMANFNLSKHYNDVRAYDRIVPAKYDLIPKELGLEYIRIATQHGKNRQQVEQSIVNLGSQIYFRVGLSLTAFKSSYSNFINVVHTIRMHSELLNLHREMGDRTIIIQAERWSAFDIFRKFKATMVGLLCYLGTVFGLIWKRPTHHHFREFPKIVRIHRHTREVFVTTDSEFGCFRIRELPALVAGDITRMREENLPETSEQQTIEDRSIEETENRETEERAAPTSAINIDTEDTNATRGVLNEAPTGGSIVSEKRTVNNTGKFRAKVCQERFANILLETQEDDFETTLDSSDRAVGKEIPNQAGNVEKNYNSKGERKKSNLKKGETGSKIGSSISDWFKKREVETKKNTVELVAMGVVESIKEFSHIHYISKKSLYRSQSNEDNSIFACTASRRMNHILMRRDDRQRENIIDMIAGEYEPEELRVLSIQDNLLRTIRIYTDLEENNLPGVMNCEVLSFVMSTTGIVRDIMIPMNTEDRMCWFHCVNIVAVRQGIIYDAKNLQKMCENEGQSVELITYLCNSIGVRVNVYADDQADFLFLQTECFHTQIDSICLVRGHWVVVGASEPADSRTLIDLLACEIRVDFVSRDLTTYKMKLAKSIHDNTQYAEMHKTILSTLSEWECEDTQVNVRLIDGVAGSGKTSNVIGYSVRPLLFISHTREKKKSLKEKYVGRGNQLSFTTQEKALSLLVTSRQTADYYNTVVLDEYTLVNPVFIYILHRLVGGRLLLVGDSKQIQLKDNKALNEWLSTMRITNSQHRHKFSWRVPTDVCKLLREKGDIEIYSLSTHDDSVRTGQDEGGLNLYRIINMHNTRKLCIICANEIMRAHIQGLFKRNYPNLTVRTALSVQGEEYRATVLYVAGLDSEHWNKDSYSYTMLTRHNHSVYALTSKNWVEEALRLPIVRYCLTVAEKNIPVTQQGLHTQPRSYLLDGKVGEIMYVLDVDDKNVVTYQKGPSSDILISTVKGSTALWGLPQRIGISITRMLNREDIGYTPKIELLGISRKIVGKYKFRPLETLMKLLEMHYTRGFSYENILLSTTMREERFNFWYDFTGHSIAVMQNKVKDDLRKKPTYKSARFSDLGFVKTYVSSDLHESLRSILGRYLVYEDTEEWEDSLLDYAKERFRLFFNFDETKIDGVRESDIELAFDRVTDGLTKKDGYEDAGELFAVLNYIKHNLKTQQKSFFMQDMAEKVAEKTNQGVLAWNKEFNLIMMWYFLVCESVLRRNLPHWAIIYNGTNEKNFEDWLTAHFNSEEPILENDFSKFDASQNLFTQKFEQWLLESLFPGYSGVLEHYYSLRRSWYARNGYVSWHSKYIKTSGEPGTLFLNCVVTMLITSLTIKCSGVRFFAVKGDDSILQAREIIPNTEHMGEQELVKIVQKRHFRSGTGYMAGSIFSEAGIFTDLPKLCAKIFSREYKSDRYRNVKQSVWEYQEGVQALIGYDLNPDRKENTILANALYYNVPKNLIEEIAIQCMLFCRMSQTVICSKMRYLSNGLERAELMSGGDLAISDGIILDDGCDVRTLFKKLKEVRVRKIMQEREKLGLNPSCKVQLNVEAARNKGETNKRSYSKSAKGQGLEELVNLGRELKSTTEKNGTQRTRVEKSYDAEIPMRITQSESKGIGLSCSNTAYGEEYRTGYQTSDVRKLTKIENRIRKRLLMKIIFIFFLWGLTMKLLKADACDGMGVISVNKESTREICNDCYFHDYHVFKPQYDGWAYVCFSRYRSESYTHSEPRDVCIEPVIDGGHVIRGKRWLYTQPDERSANVILLVSNETSITHNGTCIFTFRDDVERVRRSYQAYNEREELAAYQQTHRQLSLRRTLQSSEQVQITYLPPTTVAMASQPNNVTSVVHYKTTTVRGRFDRVELHEGWQNVFTPLTRGLMFSHEGEEINMKVHKVSMLKDHTISFIGTQCYYKERFMDSFHDSVCLFSKSDDETQTEYLDYQLVRTKTYHRMHGVLNCRQTTCKRTIDPIEEDCVSLYRLDSSLPGGLKIDYECRGEVKSMVVENTMSVTCANYEFSFRPLYGLGSDFHIVVFKSNDGYYQITDNEETRKGWYYTNNGHQPNRPRSIPLHAVEFGVNWNNGRCDFKKINWEGRDINAFIGLESDRVTNDMKLSKLHDHTAIQLVEPIAAVELRVAKIENVTECPLDCTDITIEKLEYSDMQPRLLIKYDSRLAQCDFLMIEPACDVQTVNGSTTLCATFYNRQNTLSYKCGGKSFNKDISYIVTDGYFSEYFDWSSGWSSASSAFDKATRAIVNRWWHSNTLDRNGVKRIILVVVFVAAMLITHDLLVSGITLIITIIALDVSVFGLLTSIMF